MGSIACKTRFQPTDSIKERKRNAKKTVRGWSGKDGRPTFLKVRSISDMTNSWWCFSLGCVIIIACTSDAVVALSDGEEEDNDDEEEEDAGEEDDREEPKTTDAMGLASER